MPLLSMEMDRHWKKCLILAEYMSL